MKFWERIAYVLVIGVMGFLSITYTNKSVHDSQQISCPIYSILDRPPVKTDTPDTRKIRKAIHDVRVNYHCAPPLIKSTPTMTTRTS